MRWAIILAFCLPAFGANVYYAQTSAGGNTGADCADAIAQSSISWTAGNTYHACGTLTSALTVASSGTSGNPITIFFETGAKYSNALFPVTGAIDTSSRSWVVIDGGVPCGPSVAEASCNGLIENTGNGSGLANSTDQSVGIRVVGSSNIVVQNMLVRNIYVHNSVSDTAPTGQPLPSGIYGTGVISGITIHDSKLHDANWMISFADSAVESHIVVYNSEIYNSDHCFAVGVTTQTDDDIVFHDNVCRDGANWDTTANAYHHDGQHLYGTSGGKITNALTYNNTFRGYWGVNNTAALFIEGISGSEIDDTAFNNLFVQDTTAFSWNEGFVNTGNISGTNSSVTKLYNNTFIAGTGQHAFMAQISYAVDVRNNVFITSDTANGVTIDALSTTTGTIDYNAYASTQSTPFEINNVGKSYAQWKTAGWDAHSPAGNVGTPPFNLNATTGIPLSSFIGIGAGVDLTSLGITALTTDKRSAARPNGSPWNIGAFQSATAAASSFSGKIALGGKASIN